MSDTTFLEWPFFEARHRALAARVESWVGARAEPEHCEGRALDTLCRAIVRDLGASGLLEAVVPTIGAEGLDVRSICLAREILARHSGLVEVMFAMQGLGTGPITLFGDPVLREKILPGVRAGERIAAFALSEPDAGSDVAAMSTQATAVPGGWRLDGVKTWISNGGIADPMWCLPERARRQAPRGCRHSWSMPIFPDSSSKSGWK